MVQVLKVCPVHCATLHSSLVCLQKALLPKGYPDTVSDDYLAYQAWDSVQAFASSIMNNLATQAVFRGRCVVWRV